MGIGPNEFRRVVETLKSRYRLSYPLHIRPDDPFATLVGAVLSHRTKDEMTDRAFERLFSRYKTPAEVAEAPVRELERLIRDVGFYRQKAQRLRRIAKMIIERYGGEIPRRREELMKLPGVGPKTADIVLSFAFRIPEIAIDTHVEAVVKRLGIADEKDDYETIKRKLERLTKVEDRPLINTLFVKFGKEICRRPIPKCSLCSFTDICKYYRQQVSLKRRITRP
ncbi:MAG TPA: endonuclease III [Candidatus Caldiarchaeum subterraneum]|uniref:thymine-DNA glycosylase n=1 Tax=Caldiarchaeum subterraneum TaxID=311458 RepID=A0A833E9T1_CALS0|nr:endonuclease III [Aigarchaeota archaeon]HIQ29762.1 endonuclease III [Candidatus Caldarchaeum subterraneum]